jgi:hypothetical protein
MHLRHRRTGEAFRAHVLIGSEETGMRKLIAVASATMMLAACNPAPQGEDDDERSEQSEDREDEDD